MLDRNYGFFFTVTVKRVYGYFCLPILWDANLVGRVDCKADRKTGTLLIQHLVLEKAVKNLAGFVHHFLLELKRFMAFNGCHTTVFRCVPDGRLKQILLDDGLQFDPRGVAPMATPRN